MCISGIVTTRSLCPVPRINLSKYGNSVYLNSEFIRESATDRVTFEFIKLY